MMNNSKKLKFIMIATLILQLLLPSYLLYYHYNLHAEAMANSPEFKFRLEYLDMYEVHDSGEGEDRLHYTIKDIYNHNYYREDVAVIEGSDGFVRMSLAENKRLNKYWFTYKYYSQKSYLDSSQYEYAEGFDRIDLIYHVNAMRIEGVEYPEGFYLTAKVYKGIFIPVAIYLEGKKVVVFKNEVY